MITGTIEQADFLAAQRLHYRYDRKRILAYGGLAAAAAVLGAVAWSFDQHVIYSALWGGAIGGVVGDAACRFVWAPWRSRRVYKQQRSLHESFQYRWNNQHLSCESASGSARRPWRHYTKWKEDESVFLVYHSDALFEMLPKRWFVRPEQARDFRKHLQRYIVT